MWPILAGFVSGIAAYHVFPYFWAPIPQVFAGLFGATGAGPQWLEVARLARVLAWTVLLLVAIVFLPAAIAFESMGRYGGVLWTLFHNTWLLSVAIGLCAGVICSSWYRDARERDSPNLTVRGVFVGVFATLALLAGLQQEHDFLGGLNKVSTSVFSLEFDPARRRDATTLTSNVGTAVASQETLPKWTATARIGLAMNVLSELTKRAIKLDDEAALFSIDEAGSASPSKNQNTASREASEFMEAIGLGQLVWWRVNIHETMRDSDPMFFDGGELEEAKLASLLRDVILYDLRDDPVDDNFRRRTIERVASAYGGFFIRSLTTSCIHSSWPECNIFIDDAKGFMDKEKGVAHAKYLADQFATKFPSRNAVRSAPYVVSAVASIFYANGETEAAAALLDQWLRRKTNDRTAGKLEEHISRIYKIRVLNMIGFLFADESNPGQGPNPIHLELGTKYQWAAFLESGEFVDLVPQLKVYQSDRSFDAPQDFDLIALASASRSDARGICKSTPQIPAEARYVVFRRWSLLNNVVFYLAKQPQLIEKGRHLDEFDELIKDLRSLRVDCVAYELLESKESTAEDQRQLAKTDAMARTLDTLARAMLTQATLHRRNTDQVKAALCDAHKAARAAEKFTQRFEVLIDHTSRAQGSGQGNTLPIGFDHRAFYKETLAVNGEAVVRRQPIGDAQELVRDTRNRIEKLGPGVCAR